MIIKLDRRKRKYKRIIFIILGVLLFSGSCFLSILFLFNIVKVIKYISILLLGNLGTIIVFGSIGIGLGIKVVLNEIRMFKDNNCLDEINKKCDEERKKLFIIKNNYLESVDKISDEYEYNLCDNLDRSHLRIIDNGYYDIRVKKRVRKRDDFSRHR